jgi:DNA-binding transcriptional MerR regulator
MPCRSETKIPLSGYIRQIQGLQNLGFTLNNVFEMAEELERNEAKLYRTAAKKVSHSLVKELISLHE